MAGVLRGLLGFPLRLVRAPVGFIVLLVGAQQRRTFGLPVSERSERWLPQRSVACMQAGVAICLWGDVSCGCCALRVCSRQGLPALWVAGREAGSTPVRWQ